MNRLKTIHRVTRNSELFIELPEMCVDFRGLMLKTYINGAQNGLFAESPSNNAAFACFVIDDSLPYGVHQYDIVYDNCIYVSGRFEITTRRRGDLVYSKGHTVAPCPVRDCEDAVTPPPSQGSNVFGECSC